MTPMRPTAATTLSIQPCRIVNAGSHDSHATGGFAASGDGD
jgi:hypothetical protein